MPFLPSRRPTLLLAAVAIVANAAAASSPSPLCGVGKWYDDKSADPACITCAVETWCPAGRERDSDCAPGHVGRACSECEHDHYYADDKCNLCPDRTRVIVAWICALISFAVVGVIIYHYASMDLTALTIVTTHFQLSSTYYTFAFAYPHVVTQFSTTSKVFQGFGFLVDEVGGVGSPACLGLNSVPYSMYWIFNETFPFLFMLPFAILFWRAEAKARSQQKIDAAKDPANRVLSISEYEARKSVRLVRKRAAQSILFICITTLMNGVSASFNVWFCPEFADGTFRLAASPSVVCDYHSAFYRSMLLASYFIFGVYYFGIMGLLASVINSEDARRSCAEHYVSHARLLRDSTLMQQLVFAINLIIHGPRYGADMERKRHFRKLRALVDVPIALKRLQAMAHQEPLDRIKFLGELGEVKKKYAKYQRSRLPPPTAGSAFSLDVFPVFVQDPQTGAWVPGIFHGVDDRGNPRVAVGEGSNLTMRSYDNARMDFEDGRPVAITNRLDVWQHQDENPINAMSGAPLGEFGRIAVDKQYIKHSNSFSGHRRRSSATTTLLSSISRVDISMSMTARFTFHLNLTEPLGFLVRKRWGNVHVSDVDPLGQGAVAGMSNMCVIKRIGGKTVHSVDEFQLEIVKRRIVSAFERKRIIEVGLTAHVIPLSEEDEQLLASTDIDTFFSPTELSELHAELAEQESGLFAHCTCTYMDMNFDTIRNLPSDFHAFHQLADYKAVDPYWDAYGFILCVFKSSSRHFEQWASVRKVAAIFTQTYLAYFGPGTQGTTMLLVCIVALLLQVRLRPYDDRNIMDDLNNADAIISNNDLETCLLSLQIAQLAIGLLSLVADMPSALASFLYSAIFFTAFVLSVVALSTEFARLVYALFHAIEPYITAFLGIFGVQGRSQQRSKRDRNLKRRSALHAMKLLHLANSYETAKTAKFEEAHKEKRASLSAAVKRTAGQESAELARNRHRAALLEQREALAREKSSWMARRRAVAGAGGKLVTVADKLGHLATTSIGAKARVEETARHRQESLKSTKDYQLHKEKEEWEARRRAGGGHLVTKADDLGHFNATTAAQKNRVLSHHLTAGSSFAGEALLAKEKEEWEARRRAGGGHLVTNADDLGHFNAETKTAQSRRRDSIMMRTTLGVDQEAEAAAELKRQWAERMKKKGGTTETDNIGRLGAETKAGARRKAQREAAQLAVLEEAKALEEEAEERAAHDKQRREKRKDAAADREVTRDKRTGALMSPGPPRGGERGSERGYERGSERGGDGRASLDRPPAGAGRPRVVSGESAGSRASSVEKKGTSSIAAKKKKKKKAKRTVAARPDSPSAPILELARHSTESSNSSLEASSVGSAVRSTAPSPGLNNPLDLGAGVEMV